jgi:hypothetical protein
MLALAIVYMFHLFLFSPALIITEQWANKMDKSDSEELGLYEKVSFGNLIDNHVFSSKQSLNRQLSANL